MLRITFFAAVLLVTLSTGASTQVPWQCYVPSQLPVLDTFPGMVLRRHNRDSTNAFHVLIWRSRPALCSPGSSQREALPMVRGLGSQDGAQGNMSHQPGQHFYRALPYGSQAGFSPLAAVIHSGYYNFPVDNSSRDPFAVPYGAGFDNVMQNVLHPIAVHATALMPSGVPSTSHCRSSSSSGVPLTSARIKKLVSS